VTGFIPQSKVEEFLILDIPFVPSLTFANEGSFYSSDIFIL
jgi:hypothetical protein